MTDDTSGHLDSSATLKELPSEMLSRILSPGVVERLLVLRVPLELVAELTSLNECLYQLRQEACHENVTTLKQRIDHKEAFRRQIVSKLSKPLGEPTVSRAVQRVYAETVGELCDRLIVIDLEIQKDTQRQPSEGRTSADYPSCAATSRGLRHSRRYLQGHFITMLDDMQAGFALLPPCSVFDVSDNAPQDLELRRTLENAQATAATPDCQRGRLVGNSVRHILGIACSGHGASLAYIGPDQVRASVLDRWARTKHTLMFAEAEAREILGRTSPVDAKIHKDLVHTYGRFPAYRTFEADFPAWFAWLTRDLDVDLDAIELVVSSESHFATCGARLGGRLNSWLPRARIVTSIEHHRIHQCQAFWASGMSSAGVLTLDTCGESLNRLGGRKIAGTLSHMDHRGRHRTISEFLFPETSIGVLYALVNHHVGFREGEEGKTMGLAPYGGPEFYDRLRPMLQLRDDGSFDFIDPREFHRLLGGYVPARMPKAEILPLHMNVAYAGQRLLEDCVTNALQAAARWKHDGVVYAGGVALNSVANEVARRAAGVQQMYVPPNPGDSGHALGCALLGAYEIAGWAPPEQELSDYLGPHYSSDDIEVTARSTRHHVIRATEPEDLIARCIANGHVIARFDGRAEFGPRALGNRSILSDPRRHDMRDYLNERVKLRETFRPFAPSVLLEHASEWFDLQEESPFMLRVVPVRSERAHEIPSVVHVDGTSRVQTVKRSDNPDYWRLIKAFAKLTSVPLVINTSFNLDGQPIVESPGDALACYEASRIDLLVLGNWLLSKRPIEELACRPR